MLINGICIRSGQIDKLNISSKMPKKDAAQLGRDITWEITQMFWFRSWEEDTNMEGSNKFFNNIAVGGRYQKIGNISPHSHTTHVKYDGQFPKSRLKIILTILQVQGID